MRALLAQSRHDAPLNKEPLMIAQEYIKGLGALLLDDATQGMGVH